MVKLLLSERLRKHFCAAKGSPLLSAELKGQLDAALNDEKLKAVDHAIVFQYWREASKAGVCTESLHEIVRGSGIYEEPYVPPPKPKELVERLKRLEILAAEKEYRRMVRNVDVQISEQDRLSDIRELKSVKQQAIMFMNLVLSFAGVWAFVYYALHATLETQGMRALAATLAALIALVAEIWLYLKTEIFHDAVVRKKEERKANRILNNTVAQVLAAEDKKVK